MYLIDFYNLCGVTSLRSLARETLIYGLSYSLGRIINFLLVTVYLTHLFSNEKAFYSIYNEIYFFIAIFLGLLTLRMETTFFRFISDEKLKNTIYPLASQMVFIASAIFILFIFIGIDSIESFLQYPNLRNAIYYAAFIAVIDVICSLPFSKLRYNKQATKYALIKLIGIVLNILFVILLLNYSEGTASEKLTLVILANLLSSIITLVLLIPEIKSSFVKTDWSNFRKILNYSFPLILVTLSYIFIQYGGTSILKYFLPGSVLENLEQSSQYNAAVRLAVIMNLFVTAFNYAAEPFFFRHANEQNSKQIFAKASLYFILCCCLIYLATYLFKDIIALVLDENFRGELYLLKVLLLANIFTGLYLNLSSWYKLSDRNYLMAAISIAGLVMMIVMNFLLIPILGTAAPAYANLISYFFICCVSYYQGQQYYPIPYPIFKMAAYLGFCIMMVWLLPMLFGYMEFGFWLKHLISLVILLAFCVFIYLNEIRKFRITSEN